MSRQSVIYRQIKRERIVERIGHKRKAIKKQMRDSSLSFDQKMELSFQLQKLPRDSSYVRLCNRCALTGRPRAVYQMFGICRNKLREKAMLGEVPGLTKASW